MQNTFFPSSTTLYLQDAPRLELHKSYTRMTLRLGKPGVNMGDWCYRDLPERQMWAESAVPCHQLGCSRITGIY
jgi:hypothetical protein